MVLGKRIIMMLLMVAGIVVQARPRKVKMEVKPKERICFAMYTTANSVLKMNVQLYPLKDGESRVVYLEVRKGGRWIRVAETKISEELYTPKSKDKLWLAEFRVKNWDMTRDFTYRVVALDGVATYEGKVRKDPVDKEQIVVAAFTGNSTWHSMDYRRDVVKNLKHQDPDLLFFSGDQTYRHGKHLEGWILFGQQFGEVIKDRPTVAIPDDHDVGNGNLWGESGAEWKTSNFRSQGYGDADFVKSVERVQAGNLPDPVDPVPVKRGIGTYFTSLKIGKVDFAIVEDRKFKSSPGTLEKYLKKKGIGAKFRSNNLSKFDGKIADLDMPGASLLGERQLKFLESWGKQWQGVNMKAVLSASPFSQCHTRKGNIPDLDTHCWPQSGRNRAVEALRKSFALHISGDLHLTSVTHYGLENFRDSSYSFCVPAIQNHFVRFWHDTKIEGERIEGPLPGLGDHIDPAGHCLTMHAYANPEDEYKSIKAAGYGIIKFNVNSRDIVMECWPRHVDVTKPGAKQFLGWPITIKQKDNYSRKAVAYLPSLNIKGVQNPIIQVIEEKTGKTVYTLRISGQSYRPKVFAQGKYTVIVGDQDKKQKIFKGLVADNKSKSLNVVL